MTAIRIEPPPGVAAPVWIALLARHATELVLAGGLAPDAPDAGEETLTRPAFASLEAELLSSAMHAKRSRGERSG